MVTAHKVQCSQRERGRGIAPYGFDDDLQGFIPDLAHLLRNQKTMGLVADD
jgi:hypothetical protein